MNVFPVEQLSVTTHPIKYMSKFTLVKKNKNVISLEKSLIHTLSSDNVRSFTLERNPINAMNMEEPSGRAHNFIETR